MAPTPDPDCWTRLVRLEELEANRFRAIDVRGHRVLAGRTPKGAPFAVENPCPLASLPPFQGSLRPAVLPCRWHDWKFEPDTGRCQLGGEDLHAYSTREQGGHLEIDLAAPPRDVAIPQLLASLKAGLLHNDNQHSLQAGARLLKAGLSPAQLLLELVTYDALHAEHGPDHVLPLAEDVAAMLPLYPDLEALIPIAPVIDLAGETNRQRQSRPRSAPIQGGTQADLVAAIEQGDAERAEGLVRGAFAEGRASQEVEGWLLSACSRRFVNFGHPLIFLTKSKDLLERVDDSAAEPLLSGLAFGFARARREDTLPYFAPLRQRLDALTDDIARFYASPDRAVPFDPREVRDAVLEGSAIDSFDAIFGALRRGVAPARIAQALVGAAAHRLYRFDLILASDGAVAETWLWATHRFTFATATRHAIKRFSSPDSLRFLFHSAAFTNSGQSMDAPPERRIPLGPLPHSFTPGEVALAIASGDAELAVRGLLKLLEFQQRTEPFHAPLADLLLSGASTRPIVTAHAIRTTRAALNEYADMEGHPDRGIVLAAAVRFLSSPIRDRDVRDAAENIVRAVRAGDLAPNLTP